MSTHPLSAGEARTAVERHIEVSYLRSAGVAIAEIASLQDEGGWVVWTQAAEYLRTRDPLDFLVCPPLLVTPGPIITPLPTSATLAESLAALGLALADPQDQ